MPLHRSNAFRWSGSGDSDGDTPTYPSRAWRRIGVAERCCDGCRRYRRCAFSAGTARRCQCCDEEAAAGGRNVLWAPVMMAQPVAEWRERTRQLHEGGCFRRPAPDAEELRLLRRWAALEQLRRARREPADACRSRCGSRWHLRVNRPPSAGPAWPLASRWRSSTWTPADAMWDDPRVFRHPLFRAVR